MSESVELFQSTEIELEFNQITKGHRESISKELAFGVEGSLSREAFDILYANWNANGRVFLDVDECSALLAGIATC